MKLLNVNGTTLEYEVSGSGEPVVLIHGSIIAEMFAPMCAEAALRDHYQLIRYHRRGYAGSSRATGPVSMPQQADDCRALLAALGVSTAHVVGQSYGGGVALQLALSAPEVVHSLSLLEPAGLPVTSAANLAGALTEAITLHAAGKPAEALDTFMKAVVDPDYQAIVPKILPNAEAQSIADAATVFEAELPGLAGWGVTKEQAARLTMPVLSVLGSRSGSIYPGFAETHQLLCDWIPQTERFVLTDATHLLHMINPPAMALALAAFFGRHPMAN